MESRESVAQTALRLDAEGKRGALVAFGLAAPENLERLAYLLHALLQARRYDSVIALSRAAIERGAPFWIVRMFLALGGIAAGREDEAAEALSDLRAGLPRLDPGMHARLRETAMPLINEMVTTATAGNDFAKVDRILNLWSLFAPEEAARFAVAEQIPLLDVAAMRARGMAEARLIGFPSAKEAPRRKRTAIVAMRKYFYQSLGIRSREHDIGPRFVSGFGAYGWPAVFHGLTPGDPDAEARQFQQLQALARQFNADLVVLDQLLAGEDGEGHAAQAVAAMRRDLPRLRIVACYFDAWSRDFWPGIRRAAPLADVIWSASPLLPLWDEPVFAGKLLLAPPPTGGSFAYPPPAAQPRLAFFGGVSSHNWQRGFWLAALRRAGVPLDLAVVTHEADRLLPLASFHGYMRRIQEKTFVLSLAQREDGSFSLTGRTFEVPIAGGLLVQERSADIAGYFIEGEHYLGFSDLGELRAIARFVGERPEEAEAIRRRGYDFACARYSDAALVGYLDRALYGGNGD